MNYFGTDLRQAGHYFFTLGGDSMGYRGLTFPTGNGGGIPISRYKEWPFNPEELPKTTRWGDAEYHQISGYSIYAICGSCSDSRPGTKSVFFVNGDVDKQSLRQMILSIPVAKSIIEKMPYPVKWL